MAPTDSIASLGRQNLERLKQKTLDLLPELGSPDLRFFFRFGYAAAAQRSHRAAAAGSVGQGNGRRLG